MRKVFIFALVVLAAASAVSGTELANKRKDIIEKVKVQLNDYLRIREPNKCTALTCAKEGEACRDDVECQYMTGCYDGVCRRPGEGDSCLDSLCFNISSLYCDSDVKICTKFDEEDDNCTSTCRSEKNDLYCCDEGFCTPYPQKAGDKCEYNHRHYCPEDTYCTGTEESSIGVCKLLPSTVGADCSESGMCNQGKGFYCSDDTKKCIELPGADESCFNGKCKVGLYCDITDNDTCKTCKDLGEECTWDAECKDGLWCGEENKKCSKEFPELGEYCDQRMMCKNINEQICRNNICTKKDGKCQIDDDCPDDNFYFCEDGQCKGGLGIKEGERCFLFDPDMEDFSYLLASMQCEEGLGCVPDERGEINGTCKKVTTKIEDHKSCDSDDDCELDSFCGCNDENGKMECIPIPTASRAFVNAYTDYYSALAECGEEYGGDDEKARLCSISYLEKLTNEINREFHSYNAEYRCPYYSSSEPSSSSSPSPSPPPIYHESSSSSSELSRSSSYLVPTPTKYVEIEFKKGGMKKNEVDELVKPYIPSGEKYEITITEDKGGKTKAIVEFNNPSAAENFVKSLEASSGSAKSLITDIKYLDTKPTSTASVTFPNFSALVAVKLLFFLMK